MKQKTRRLFSLLLALVMVLSLAVPALAAEDEAPEKELHWVHLDWNESGCSASADALKTDNPGEGNGTEYDLSREDAVLFFIWNNKTNKREGYVVPTAGDGLVVEKLPKDAIASGAKQSQYYVFLRMTEFKDSEVTASGLSFKVTAKLGDFGFYSAETPSAETILVHETTQDKLTGSALYLVEPYRGTDEAKDHETIVSAEKGNPEDDDNRKCYDIEKVEDGLWKITINDAGKIALKQWSGVNVYLHLSVKRPDGSTYDWGGGVFVHGEEQAPQLFFVFADGEWDEAKEQDAYYVSKHPSGAGNGFQVHTGSDEVGMFGTIKDGEQAYTENGFNYAAFTPVDVKTLKPSDGLTVESVSGQAKKGEKWGKYFVKVSVAENGKEYKLTSGDYAITVDSGLPEIGVYTSDTASLDNWCGQKLPYHPAADDTYYIISTATDAKHGRHLVDAKINPDFPGKDEMSLEKVSDGVYKLVFKDVMNRNSFHVEADLTWTDFLGNTYTDEHSYFGDFDSRASIVASSTALTDGTKIGDELKILEYSAVADKNVSTEITLNVGEKKDVYLYVSVFFAMGNEEPSWKVYHWDEHNFFHSADPALTVTEDEKDFSKFTLTASKAGTYEIWLGQPYDVGSLRLSHADGKAYTDAEMDKFNEDYTWRLSSEGKLRFRIDGEWKPFEDVFPGESYTIDAGVWDYGYQRLTVTVKGEAKTFTDVKTTDWFYDKVNWAVAQGIAQGTGSDTFSPAKTCTHGEIITMLWNSQGKKKATAASPLKVSVWFQDAVDWAYENKVIDGTFNADADCSRADAAAYIWKFAGAPTGSPATSFTDVPADAAYIQAVNWAVEKGIVSGTGSNTFLPELICSRADIVTLLYMAYAK